MPSLWGSSSPALQRAIKRVWGSFPKFGLPLHPKEPAGGNLRRDVPHRRETFVAGGRHLLNGNDQAVRPSPSPFQSSYPRMGLGLSASDGTALAGKGRKAA